MLLTAAAEDAPLLVLVDDAQWIDAASADALLFAARRLFAEPIAVIIACREQEGGVFGGSAFESIRLGALTSGRRRRCSRPTARGSRPRSPGGCGGATGGNPLALLELPGLLTARQMAGLEPIKEPVPVGLRLVRAFAQRALRLPADAQQALLVAALSSSPRVEMVVEAMRLLDLEAGSLERAEDAGLIGVDASRLRSGTRWCGRRWCRRRRPRRVGVRIARRPTRWRGVRLMSARGISRPRLAVSTSRPRRRCGDRRPDIQQDHTGTRRILRPSLCTEGGRDELC